MLLEGDALNKVYADFRRKEDEEGDGLELTEFVESILRWVPQVVLLGFCRKKELTVCAG